MKIQKLTWVLKFVSLLYAYNNGKSFQKASAITKFILKLLFAFKWSL